MLFGALYLVFYGDLYQIVFLFFFCVFKFSLKSYLIISPTLNRFYIDYLEIYIQSHFLHINALFNADKFHPD